MPEPQYHHIACEVSLFSILTWFQALKGRWYSFTYFCHHSAPKNIFPINSAISDWTVAKYIQHINHTSQFFISHQLLHMMNPSLPFWINSPSSLPLPSSRLLNSSQVPALPVQPLSPPTPSHSQSHWAAANIFPAFFSLHLYCHPLQKAVNHTGWHTAPSGLLCFTQRATNISFSSWFAMHGTLL